MKQYSLYLLGGPEDNAVSKIIFEKIPFQIKSDEIIIDGKSFKVKDAILNAVYPNPYNHERYVDLVAATSGAGLSFFNPRQRDLYQYDYTITDGKIPTYSAGATINKIMIASGFFNENWKMDKAFLQEGSEELRSKCATIVLNNDLSMKIVSAAQPTLELLKSYTGMYQIEGGPQVRVFLDQDKLRAAQIPSEQSVEMLAVSDNEFYIKEINISLSFRKNEASHEFTMVGYESGQEFTSKKVK
jgi:hypothetical protein